MTDFTEAYHELRNHIITRSKAYWQSKLDKMTAETGLVAIKEAATIKTELTPLFVLATRHGLDDLPPSLQAAIMRRGERLRDIMLLYRTFFEITSQEDKEVVEDMLLVDDIARRECQRVGALYNLVEPILDGLRFPSVLEQMAKAAE